MKTIFKKIFSVKEDWCHYVISFLGITIKVRSLKLTIKNLFKTAGSRSIISSQKAFVFSNKDKLSTEQKLWFISQKFYEEVGYFPNIKSPKSFNEKLNWMKLNYFNPSESNAIDKYEFKNYIENKLGNGYVVPLIGVYNDVNDIDFAGLPEKFVMKTTGNGSLTGVEIVKNKADLDIDFIKYKFNNLLQEWNTVYYSCLSKGYESIKPRIIIEEYIEEISGQLYDYKFFCFHGKAKFVYVAVDHFPGVVSKISLYDLNWTKLPVTYNNHPPIDRVIPKPENFEKMVELAEKLAEDFPFVRVDFYNVKNKVLVGELTFTPGGAFGAYSPRSWDYQMGEWLDLSKLPDKYVNVLPEFQKR